ncbi:MAG: transposase [Candidatus Ancillula sp.]|nr:transposase [Candidatus Ancillula sp.]
MCKTKTPSSEHQVYSNELKSKAVYLINSGWTKQEICEELDITSVHTLRNWLRASSAKMYTIYINQQV